jgi:tetratricopeptide (TPR) repeat protein
LPATDIAGELGVDALVEGSLLGKGGTIEVAVQVIDGRSDEHLWAEHYKRETPYVFNMVGDMAAAIGAEIGATTSPPGDERPIDDRRGPIDPRAIDAYALGSANLDRFTRDGIRAAIEQLETAVALEPDFAPAWGRLAAAHAMQGLYGFAPPRDALEKGWAAALAAVEADEQFYGGHSALGWGRLWTGDFEGACELFAEALRLNPSGPAAIHGEADCLMLEGRWDESIARLREILMISPFSAGQSMPLPYHLYVARRFDEAIAAAKDMQARIPRFSMHWFFGLVYWQQGRYDEALEEERLELERRGDAVLLAALNQGFEAEGPTGAMRAKAEAQVARANETYVEPFDIAESFARAGMVDETLHWLEKAVEYGSYKMTYLAFWPHFDLVRDDPRYQDLVERVYGEKAEEIRRAARLDGGQARP